MFLRPYRGMTLTNYCLRRQKLSATLLWYNVGCIDTQDVKTRSKYCGACSPKTRHMEKGYGKMHAKLPGGTIEHGRALPLR